MEVDDKRLDKYGRELVFKQEQFNPGVYGPHTKPNRATRRKAGIRTPLIQLEAYKGYMEMLEEMVIDEGA